MIEHILVDPTTKQLLLVDYETKSILNLTEKFKSNVSHQMITILPSAITSSLGKSSLHDKTDSTFEYLNHYDEDAKVFDYQNSYTQPVTISEIKRLHQTILKQIPPSAAIILDVGCGSGWVSKNLVSDTRTVISMDISTTNPKNAILSNPHKNHHALVADAYNMPIKPNSIDCIIASEIMEHVSDPKLFVSKLLEVIKPGGKLIITTPYDEKINHHLCVHCNKPTPEHAHLHSFNLEKAKSLIPNAISKSKVCAFSNKYFIRLRIYHLLRFLPYVLWKPIDAIVNKIIHKPTRLLMTIIK